MEDTLYANELMEQYRANAQAMDVEAGLSCTVHHLHSSLCQQCGGDFGMTLIHNDTLDRYPLEPGEVVYRHQDDPDDADYVWMVCEVCNPGEIIPPDFAQVGT